MQPKVSVIVPIYNVEKYIERCACSLMEQTLQEVEYIFINDCTPDRSIEILQRVLNDYPEKASMVRILEHDVNKGLATTRNTGLDAASGEYIIYCDSDDWVERDMYETMYNKAKETNADIVVTDFYNEYPNHALIQSQPYPNNPLECVRKMLAGELHCSTCNKMVRKKVYIENNVRFPDGINMWEDVLTTIPLCYYAKKIAYIPKAYYHYAQFNMNSYTKQISKQSLLNLIEAVRRLENFLKTNGISVLDKEMCYTKLTVKLNLLLNSEKQQQQEWSNIYPEANAHLFTYAAMSLYWRIALGFVACRLLPMFNLMAKMAKRNGAR